jgi:hypothetical protein
MNFFRKTEISTNTRGDRPGRTHARVNERQQWHSILLLLTFMS